MCNTLHPDSQPIPETGTGYKIFIADEKFKLFHPVFKPGTGDPIKIGKKMQWNYTKIVNANHLYEIFGTYIHKSRCKKISKKSGFAFFLDYETALESIKDMIKNNNFLDIVGNITLCEIIYWKGLGKHKEPKLHLTSGNIPVIALAKEYKIIKILDTCRWYSDTLETYNPI